MAEKGYGHVCKMSPIHTLPARARVSTPTRSVKLVTANRFVSITKNMAQRAGYTDAQTMVRSLVFDRRGRARKPDPPCPTCHVAPEHVRVTSRIGHRVFFKCEHCGSVWDAEKPRRR